MDLGDKTQVDWELAAIDYINGDEGMLMAPARAIARLLARHRLTFADIASWNVHEAFAGQVVANLRLAADADYRKERAGVDADLGAFPWERVMAARFRSAIRSLPPARASSARRRRN